MRVTKTIREYVCRRVNESMNIKSPVEIECEERSKVRKEAREELNAKIESYAKELIDNYNSRFQLKGDEAFYYNEYHSPAQMHDLYNTDLFIRARAARKERAEKIEHSIEDILVALELGACKDDLEKMLRKLSN